MISITLFKKRCREIKNKENALKQDFELLLRAQKQYSSEYLPKKRFSWRKLWWVPVCPNCRNELDVNVLEKEAILDENTSMKSLQTCFNCNYAYASEVKTK